MRIGKAAKELSVSAEWLRALERRGVIPRARRDRNGQRRYQAEDLDRLLDLIYPVANKSQGEAQGGAERAG